MPVVLESAAYNIGYAVGQVIGVVILIAIPASIGFVIYRLTRKKPEATSAKPAFDYGLEPMMLGRNQGGPCPGCGIQAKPDEVYCGNCGRQLQPVP